LITFTPQQAADALKVSRSKIMHWILNGELAAANLSTSGKPLYRIDEEDLHALLESRRVKPLGKLRTADKRITTQTTKDYFAIP
jgi:excisionase family DNA binding protein